MTRDDIIRMAREAGLGVYLAPQWQLHEELECFAALVAAAEREACAKVCENDESKAWDWSGNTRVGNYFARAIRARGQDPMPLFDDWPQFACPPCNHNCNQGRDCPNA